MIITNNVKLIIMLCDAEEELINPVCAFYWSDDTYKTFGDVTVQTISTEEIAPKLKAIKMMASRPNTEPKEVTLLQYSDWQDNTAL